MIAMFGPRREKATCGQQVAAHPHAPQPGERCRGRKPDGLGNPPPRQPRTKNQLRARGIHRWVISQIISLKCSGVSADTATTATAAREKTDPVRCFTPPAFVEIPNFAWEAQYLRASGRASGENRTWPRVPGVVADFRAGAAVTHSDAMFQNLTASKAAPVRVSGANDSGGGYREIEVP